MVNAVDYLRKRDFILDQLSRYAGEKRQSSSRVMVQCPFHPDKTPSGSIRMESGRFVGSFRCFGCGKKADWDELAPRLGLQPFERGAPKEENSVDLFMERALAQLTRTQRYREPKPLEQFPIPPDKLWRGIPTNLLISIGGSLNLYREYHPDYGEWQEKLLYFPVKINGEQHGSFRARLKAHPVMPKYPLAAADGSGWSSTHGLWPYHYALSMMERMGSQTIVLVEGQRDALRLLNSGIPAICIFGTQSWTPEKARLLLSSGVDHVVLMFDGDDAGIQATKQIAPTLDKFIELSVIRLWNIKGGPYEQFAHLPEPSKAAKKAGVELYDPGNVPEAILHRLKRKFF